MATELLRPNANGNAVDALIGLVPDTGEDAYEDIDEVVSDDDTTYLWNSAKVDYRTGWFGLPAHSIPASARILSVEVIANVGAQEAPSQASLKIGVYIGAAEFLSAAKTVTAAYGEQSETWTTNPDTTDPWTRTDIGNLEIGFSIRGVNAALFRRTKVTQLWVVVSYATITTKTVAMDALLEATDSKTVALDTHIAARVSKTVALDTHIASRLTETIALDAYLRATDQKTVSLDTLLRQTDQKTVALDTHIASRLTETIALDAHIAARVPETVALDTWLRGTVTETVALDAYIEATDRKTVALDIILIRALAPELIYSLEIRDSSGDLVAILERAHGIDYRQVVNTPYTLQFKIPATDSKVDDIAISNEYWLRDNRTGDVVRKFTLQRRRDVRQ